MREALSWAVTGRASIKSIKLIQYRRLAHSCRTNHTDHREIRVLGQELHQKKKNIHTENMTLGFDHDFFFFFVNLH